MSGVQIHAIKGNTRRALDLLRNTFDNGWVVNWWLYLELDPALDDIRDEPEFQSVLYAVRDEMATQLRQVKALVAAGELESIPDSK